METDQSPRRLDERETAAANGAGARRGPGTRPCELGPLRLRNRVIKAATFEGRCERNAVSEDLIEFHREVAAGGVAMTTLAFCAVSRDARGCARRARSVARRRLLDWHDLADAVHAEGALAAAQVGHAGAVAAGIGVQGRVAVAGVLTAGHAANKGPCGDRDPFDHRRLRRRVPTAGRGGLRRDRAALRPRLPAVGVPQPQAQQAHRRVGWHRRATRPALPGDRGRSPGLGPRTRWRSPRS